MSSMWTRPELIWFIVGLFFLLAEFVLPGFIIFFFGVGAWVVALICLFFDVPVNFQLLIFLVASLALLVSLRRWVKKIFIGKQSLVEEEKGEVSDFVGEKATVIEKIIPGKVGKVEFHGSRWNAVADMEIPKDEMVEIISISSLTLKVKHLKGQ